MFWKKNAGSKGWSVPVGDVLSYLPVRFVRLVQMGGASTDLSSEIVQSGALLGMATIRATPSPAYPDIVPMGWIPEVPKVDLELVPAASRTSDGVSFVFLDDVELTPIVAAAIPERCDWIVLPGHGARIAMAQGEPIEIGVAKDGQGLVLKDGTRPDPAFFEGKVAVMVDGMGISCGGSLALQVSAVISSTTQGEVKPPLNARNLFLSHLSERRDMAREMSSAHRGVAADIDAYGRIMSDPPVLLEQVDEPYNDEAFAFACAGIVKTIYDDIPDLKGVAAFCQAGPYTLAGFSMRGGEYTAELFEKMDAAAKAIGTSIPEDSASISFTGELPSIRTWFDGAPMAFLSSGRKVSSVVIASQTFTMFVHPEFAGMLCDDGEEVLQLILWDVDRSK